MVIQSPLTMEMGDILLSLTDSSNENGPESFRQESVSRDYVLR
jgi:hypothetical protein